MPTGPNTAKVVAPGDAAAKLGETAVMVEAATTTTAVVVAAVVEAREPRRVLVEAQAAVKGANNVEPTGAVGAALREAPEGGGTAHEVVQRGVARPSRPACRQARERTTPR